MASSAIINASPLIFLTRSHHLELLKAVADEVWIPEPVAEEILRRGQHDITAKAIEETDWLIGKPVGSIPTAILDWRLGAGESAVLALAIKHQLEVIIDDIAGRKCAARFDIPVRGTLGIVFVAKKRGIIHQGLPIREWEFSTDAGSHKKSRDRFKRFHRPTRLRRTRTST